MRAYLAEFLSDPRVVPLPRWLWLPVLHGIVLRTRPAKSAHKYAQIWMPEGSPLDCWVTHLNLDAPSRARNAARIRLHRARRRFAHALAEEDESVKRTQPAGHVSLTAMRTEDSG